MRASAWTLKTGPSQEPLSVEQAKAHLRVSAPDEDGLIAEYIKAARSWCEEYCGRAFTTQVWLAHFKAWPWDGKLELPLPPLVSVEGISWTDWQGAVHTLGQSVYKVITAHEPGAVILATNQTWPADTLDVGLPIVVEFTCGYGDPSLVPVGAKQAMRWLVGHYFENREGVTMANVPPTMLPMGVRWALDPIRCRYDW